MSGLQCYQFTEEELLKIDGDSLQNIDFSSGPCWIDITSPTKEEEDLVEALLSLDIPTLYEVNKIEESSRFYIEKGALFMTIFLTVKDPYKLLRTEMITFIIKPSYLVTVRYCDFSVFQQVKTNLSALQETPSFSIDKILINILYLFRYEITKELQDIKNCLERLNFEAFGQEELHISPESNKLRMQIIGRKNSRIIKELDNILSLSRVTHFLNSLGFIKENKESLIQLRETENDLRAMDNYARQLSGELNFLLQASLGMLNIEQNKIIKAFTVISVLFLPPSLIATIYGMNFQYLPELSWSLGYPYALLIMALSCVVPYLYLRKRKWL